MSCAYWKGPLLRGVLLAAGVPEKIDGGRRLWVNFEGADEPSEGKYATCIPFEYAMDLTNDVILAYEMNDVPLRPEHGHPVRVLILGYVGGRCVKWLHKIWVGDRRTIRTTTSGTTECSLDSLLKGWRIRKRWIHAPKQCMQ